MVSRRMKARAAVSQCAASIIVLIATAACISAPVRNRSPGEQARDEDMAARNLVNPPHRFTAVPEAGADSTLSAQGTICPRAFVDSGSGTRLRLVRVLSVGRGDYAASVEQAYGARPGELIRLHCGNGTPAGFVSR